MRLSTQDKASWSAEYKKYRSTDKQIEQNREANRLQRERDDNAARGNSSNTHTSGERAVPADNRAS
jgi:hypothetical protein